MRYWVMIKSAYEKEQKQGNVRVNKISCLKLYQSLIGRNDRQSKVKQMHECKILSSEKTNHRGNHVHLYLLCHRDTIFLHF
jgi:hypothetical protein